MMACPYVVCEGAPPGRVSAPWLRMNGAVFAVHGPKGTRHSPFGMCDAGFDTGCTTRTYRPGLPSAFDEHIVSPFPVSRRPPSPKAVTILISDR